MLHEPAYCDVCRKNFAVFSISRQVDGVTMRQRLCKECAAQQGSAQAWLQAIEQQPGESGADDTTVLEELQQFSTPFLDIDGLDADEDEDDDFAGFDLTEDELDELLSEDEAIFDELADGEPDEGDEFSPGEGEPAEFDSGSLPPEILSKRCPKCDTTWDRLREDGRAGCAQCYEAFEEKLFEVMGRMQREAHHVGKAPRARLKRRQRLEHLRKQRDHRLEMLQNRLKEAIAVENYEDAAALRDKIKMVEATIVDDK